jgi:hydroxymethylpyrimidine pyrophosphatase-like HAD family hydrolase
MAGTIKQVPSTRPFVACVDFDGVIADYSGGYQGMGVFGDPIPGAAESLQYLSKKGWKIVIYTGRGEKGLVSAYLNRYQIPFDAINQNVEGIHQAESMSPKPVADVYLDDRGISFNGSWDKALRDIDDLMRRKGPLPFRLDNK